MNFESRPQPALGLDFEPSDVIGRGGSLEYSMQLRGTLLAIRPRRESETGWTPEAQRPLGNHSSLAVNERGPALKVFWSRCWRDGRRVGESARLPKSARGVEERLTKKTEPEGAGSGIIRSAPFGSKVGQTAHRLRRR